MVAGLLLSPVLVVMLVVAGYVWINSRHPPAPARAGAPTRPAVAPTTPGPTLGPWKHIENRSLDSQPLTVAELFPARFSAVGFAGVRTVTQSGTTCQPALIGSALRAAAHKAGCSQVIRASYLSSNRKFMATIGVLNLRDVQSATRAGRVAGASQFIKQLPAAHGPTHRLAQGTGLEEADVMGHYLILTWAEFTNLHKPSGKAQLAGLAAFSKALITGTANVSLTSRMLTGKPRVT